MSIKNLSTSFVWIFISNGNGQKRSKWYRNGNRRTVANWRLDQPVAPQVIEVHSLLLPRVTNKFGHLRCSRDLPAITKGDEDHVRKKKMNKINPDHGAYACYRNKNGCFTYTHIKIQIRIQLQPELQIQIHGHTSACVCHCFIMMASLGLLNFPLLHSPDVFYIVLHNFSYV